MKVDVFAHCFCNFLGWVLEIDLDNLIFADLRKCLQKKHESPRIKEQK